MKAIDAVEDLRRLRAVVEAGGRLDVAATALGLQRGSLRGWLRRIGLASGTHSPVLRALMAEQLLAQLEADTLEVAA